LNPMAAKNYEPNTQKIKSNNQTHKQNTTWGEQLGANSANTVWLFLQNASSILPTVQGQFRLNLLKMYTATTKWISAV